MGKGYNHGMKKLQKRLLIGAGVVVGLIVVTLVIVFLSLNRIVRSAVESGATRSLKVKTTLDSASVSPFGGSAALSDLKIGSPEGFSSPHMFTLGEVSVASSLGYLFGDPVHVVTIKIVKPHLVLEQANGKFNFMVLKDNLSSGKPAPTEPADPNAKPFKLVIESLDVTGAQISLRPGIPGVKEQYDITVPAIRLKNIGNADGTQTGEEIGRVVTDLVGALAAKAAESEQVPPEVRQLLKLNVDQVISDVKAQIQDRATAATQKAGEKIEKEAARQLDKLLGGDKKKDEKKK